MWAVLGVAYAGGAIEVCNGVDDDRDGLIDEVVASIGSRAFDDVGEALDAACPGEVVRVCPGFHEVGELIVRPGVTLAGSGASSTTLHSKDGRSMKVEDGELRDLRIEAWIWVAGHSTGRSLNVVGGLSVGGETEGQEATLDLWSSMLEGVDASASVAVRPKSVADLHDSSVGPTWVGAWVSQGAVLRGGVFAFSDVGVRLDGGTLEDAAVLANRVGVVVYGGLATVDGSWVSGNADGGIVATEAGCGFCDWGPVSVRGSKVVENGGPGVDVFEVELVDATISDNAGRGVLAGRLRATDSVVEGNQGGGVDAHDIELVGTTIARNTARYGAGVLSFGSLLGDGKSEIVDNLATEEGGGFAGAGEVSGVTIARNAARRGAGVAALGSTIWGRVALEIRDAVIADNIADEVGGAVNVEVADVHVSWSTVLRNEAPEGGGAFLGTDGDPTFTAACSDLGVGADDNQVGDVWIPSSDGSPRVVQVASEYVSCDRDGCLFAAPLCDDKEVEVRP